MSEVKNLTKPLTLKQKSKVDRIVKLFDELKKDGVDWESIDGGGGGYLHFFRCKKKKDVKRVVLILSNSGGIDYGDLDNFIDTKIDMNVSVP